MSRQWLPISFSAVMHACALGSLYFFAHSPHVLPKGLPLAGDPAFVEMAVQTPVKPAVRTHQQIVDDKGLAVLKKKVEPKKEIPVEPIPKDTPANSNASTTGASSPTQGPVGDTSGRQASDRERYIFELRTLIQNRKTYPANARRLGETGKVMVEFMIALDGKISSVHILKSSGSSRLDDAASTLINGIGTYKPLPATADAKEWHVEVPIEYLLN